MDDKEMLLKKMRKGQFVKNNGRVLRAINILRSKYVSLQDAHFALDDIDEADFIDCINYLQRSGYIDLRKIEGHISAMLADCEYTELEAAVSAYGIRLLGGDFTDRMVDI